MKRTMLEYKEVFNGAPVELSDFAYAATDVTDDPEFAKVAEQYFAAKGAFKAALADRGIEIG